MSSDYNYTFKGEPNIESTGRKGRRVTLVAAISTKGIESLMLVDGGCKAPQYCYFMAETIKKWQKRHRNEPYIQNGEGLIIYDNCSAHMSGFSGWFMR